MKRSPLIILFVTVVIDLVGFGIIFPLLPLYVKQFDGTPRTAGYLAASFSVMQFVFAPLWGRASDVWGRRPLILLGLLGSAAAFLLFGLATQMWMLFAARIAAGILTAASLPASYAYIADVTPPEKRSRGMAMIGVAFGVGFAMGPWIGGALGRYGLSVPAFFVAGLAGLNFVWSFFALPETRHRDEAPGERRKIVFLDTKSLAAAFRKPVLGELLTLFCVSTFAFALMEATFTWYVLIRFIEPHLGVSMVRSALEKVAANTVGPIFGVVGITICVAQGAVMGGLGQRVGDRALVWTGSLLLAVTLFGLVGAGSIGLVTLLAAMLALGEGLMSPALNSLLSREAGRDERGGIMGVTQGLGSLARIAAQLIGTWLLERFGTGAPYLAAGVMMALAFLLSLGVGRGPVDTHA